MDDYSLSSSRVHMPEVTIGQSEPVRVAYECEVCGKLCNTLWPRYGAMVCGGCDDDMTYTAIKPTLWQRVTNWMLGWANRELR